ncbi:hypothetical protein DAT35_53055 [Vitiosangium sp. GDMCC 1.1324]|nr:hypothetical protein DAT35_53055 [Vitiosangium sp. GDMCC 1.1324]
MAMLVVLAVGLAADLALWRSSSSSNRERIADKSAEQQPGEPRGMRVTAVPASYVKDASDSGVSVERVGLGVRTDRLPSDSMAFTSSP